ncbi:ribosome maturation factor RimP [Pseudarcicella hirudinis]|uniref:Ribosome maturation factor RimP n=1 Tax=Pseudarcicella hirudinis TaxID=1079859 RepID=A0A1I5QTT2_9BACT|nr:ribosome assembly cofactor RimP [Pseudarcicella hirudinis]SFP49655.1 ribosome maturation factor RimP [Pseudarcicella hirudinis]
MLKDKITELLQKYLEDDRLFIVEVEVGQSKTRSNVTILLDSDIGITIEECAKISRKLGHEIEELNLIESAFNLEVSSPGIDQPLKFRRQYVKNIGRSVKIILKDGSEKKGSLDAVSDEGITITEELKKKPKKGEEHGPLEIPFSNIEQTKIQISFK